MKVVVGIIFDDEQRLLITQRARQAEHGGLWEFPGGKVEPGEMADAALVREIKEEVGLDVLEHEFIGEVQHCYGKQPISLLLYLVKKFIGKAVCCENQMDLHWVDWDSLNQFTFPAANLEIIKRIESRLTSNLATIT